MHTIGIAQAGQGAMRGQQHQHFSDAWEKAFRPAPEVVEERLRRHSKAPFCHDASGKCFWCTPPRLKRTYPGRGCEPTLPHLFLGQRSAQHALKCCHTLYVNQHPTEIKQDNLICLWGLPVSSHVIWQVRLATPQADRCQSVPLLPICEQMFIAWTLSLLSDKHSHSLLFLAIGFVHKKPAKVGDSQPDKIGREGVAYIVLHNPLDIAIKPHLSHVLPIHELPIYIHHLAGDTREGGQFMQR